MKSEYGYTWNIMKLVKVTDKNILFNFLSQDIALNNYTIGDLDDFFWTKTTYWGWMDFDERIRAIVLVYAGAETPTVIAF